MKSKENIELSKIRHKLGLKQVDFAQKLGVARTYISMIESGAKPFSDKLRRKIDKVFGKIEIESEETSPGSRRSEIMELVPVSNKIPVVGMAAAAGYDPVFNQICDLWECSGEEIPCGIDRDDIFAIRISGDSMEPTLYDGDIIAVDPNDLPSTGKLAVVNVLHEGLLIKRWYWRKGIVRLESINPAGKSFEWPIAQVQAEGLIRWRWKVLALLYRAL